MFEIAEDHLPAATPEQEFDCLMCGHCCQGKGGIVVSTHDLARLCDHFSVSPSDFEAEWGERRGGKLLLRSNSGGCVFFRPGTGCSVHKAKPAICRAWPYFRGNLVDAESFAMAKSFCPGIPADLPHDLFVSQGLTYLCKSGLAGTRGADEATALQVDDLLEDLASTPVKR